MIKHELDLLEVEIKNKKKLFMSVTQDSPGKRLTSKYNHTKKKNTDLLVTEPYDKDLLTLAPNIAKINPTPSKGTNRSRETLEVN